MKFHFSAYLFGFASLWAETVNCNSTCSIARDMANDCGRRLLIIGDGSRSLPKSMNEFPEYCRTLKDDINCLATYSQCLTSFKQVMTKAISRYLDIKFVHFCQNDDLKKKMLLFSKCDSDQKLHALDQCMDKAAFFLTNMRDETEPEQSYSSLCCFFRWLQSCFNRSSLDACPSLAYGDVAWHLDNLLVRLMKKIVDYDPECEAEFRSMTACRETSSDLSDLIRKLTSKDPIKLNGTSVLLLLVDVIIGKDEK